MNLRTTAAPQVQADPILPAIPVEVSGAYATDYLRVFTRRKWMLIIPSVVCIAAAFVVAKLVPQQFNAGSMVEAFDRQQIDKILNAVQVTVSPKPYLTTIAEIIKTRQFLGDLIDKVGISEGYDTRNPRERALLLTRVRKNVDVKLTEQKTGNDLIEVQYTGRDAEKVANFVSAITDKYMQQVMFNFVNEIKAPRSTVLQQLKDAGRALDEASREYRIFQESESFPDVGDKALVTKNGELYKAQFERDNLEITLHARQERLDKLNQTLQAVPETSVSGGTRKRNPAWERQNAVVAGLERALAEEKARWKIESSLAKKLGSRLILEGEILNTLPEFIDDTQTVATNQKFTDLDIKRVELETDIRGMTAQITKLNEYIAVTSKLVARLPAVLGRAEVLRQRKDDAARRVNRLQDTVNLFEGAWNRVNSKEGQFFNLLRTPTPSDAENWDPIFPNVGLFLGIGAFAGLLFGAGLAFIKEFGSRSYVTVGQVRKNLPVAFLGEVGVLVSDHDDRRVARNRRLRLVVLLVFAAALLGLHVAFFVPALKTLIPPHLFELMSKVYGSR